MVCSKDSTMNEYSEERTSSTSNLTANNMVVKRLHKKIAKYLGVDLKKGEALQGQRYEVGEYFNDHTDYFTPETYKQNCLVSGQRTFTFMLYLNDDFEGGTTSFKFLNKEFKPEACKAVVWNNLEYGQPNKYMTHCGNEVTKGKKYIITSWWRENEWQSGVDYKEYMTTVKNVQLSII
tara:strand:- start:542 stop:1075 length:534 start_codon:yes stop_codon:yes gene_type:complete